MALLFFVFFSFFFVNLVSERVKEMDLKLKLTFMMN